MSKGEKERREGKRKACEKYLDYSMKLILLNHIKQEHKSIGKFQDAIRSTRGCSNLEKNIFNDSAPTILHLSASLKVTGKTFSAA